ncbi:MAG: sodium-dependent transporter [Succinivibrio sp.]
MNISKQNPRELFSSRLGFLLIAAGCSIGLGNVWRFPYMAGQYGGSLFVIIYLVFLLALGVPLVTIELAIGRSSRRSIGMSFETLTPGSKWKYCKYFMIMGNYVLMGFYTMVTGWMLYYTVKMVSGDFTGSVLSQAQSGQSFNLMLSDASSQILFTLIVTVIAFSVCALGLRKGVERITKPMMVLLFLLLIFLSARSFFLSGFADGIRYYLYPDFSKFKIENLYEIASAALGQAFFTLGLGVGSLQIFGSYMSSGRSITNEACVIAALDTLVAVLSGFIIFPACFSYEVSPGQGPGLIFVTLVSVFSNMHYGQIWGSVFFLFMFFAAISTLIAVFENIIGITLDMFRVKRVTAVLINFVIIMILALPVILGFNRLSFIQPMGEGSVILDLYDFILSQNIIVLGSVIYVLYASWNFGWGFEKYSQEAGQGAGFRISSKFKSYFRYVLPVVVMILFVNGYISVFK